MNPMLQLPQTVTPIALLEEERKAAGEDGFSALSSVFLAANTRRTSDLSAVMQRHLTLDSFSECTIHYAAWQARSTALGFLCLTEIIDRKSTRLNSSH